MRAKFRDAAANVARRLGEAAEEEVSSAVAWRRARPCIMAEHHRLMLLGAPRVGLPWHRFWHRFWFARCVAAEHDPKICGGGE